jgi:hypothetical protein
LILGERLGGPGRTKLIQIAETAQDGFLAEAAAEALGKVADPPALTKPPGMNHPQFDLPLARLLAGLQIAEP